MARVHHVIQSCSQGNSAVVGIMHYVLTTLKQEHPEINTAFFRQDNAWCYHSSRTILACRRMGTRCRNRMARIDFSDPQGGKGAADRLATSCKFHIRAYINEGQDVCTANDMKIALISNGGLERVRVVSMDTIAETQDTAQTVANITKLNNFEFTSTDTVTCWRAYGVGPGDVIKLDVSSFRSSGE